MAFIHILISPKHRIHPNSDNSPSLFRTYKSATQETINKNYKSWVHKTAFCIFYSSSKSSETLKGLKLLFLPKFYNSPLTFVYALIKNQHAVHIVSRRENSVVALRLPTNNERRNKT